MLKVYFAYYEEQYEEYEKPVRITSQTDVVVAETIQEALAMLMYQYPQTMDFMWTLTEIDINKKNIHGIKK